MRSELFTIHNLGRFAMAETENQELDDENDDDAPESGEGDPESLQEEWETESDSTTYELHRFEDGHFEIMVVGGAFEDEPDDTEHAVLIAMNLKEVDEAIGILKEVREKMVLLDKVLQKK